MAFYKKMNFWKSGKETYTFEQTEGERFFILYFYSYFLCFKFLFPKE